MDEQSTEAVTKIAATPEVMIRGVDGAVTPTIMKCSMGGWIVSIPGKGIAAKSTLDEAMDFLADQAFEFFGEPRTDFPKCATHFEYETREEPRPRLSSAIHAFFSSFSARLGY